MKYIFNILIALDQLGNTLFGGDPQETISSRSDKAMKEGKKWGCVMCKFLALFQKDHCQKAYEKSVGFNGVLPD